jgi:hypothetical protein
METVFINLVNWKWNLLSKAENRRSSREVDTLTGPYRLLKIKMGHTPFTITSSIVTASYYRSVHHPLLTISDTLYPQNPYATYFPLLTTIYHASTPPSFSELPYPTLYRYFSKPINTLPSRVNIVKLIKDKLVFIHSIT